MMMILAKMWAIHSDISMHTPGDFSFRELEVSLAKAPLGVSLSLSRAGVTERLYTISPCGSVFKCLIFIRVTVVLEKEMATHSSTLAWGTPWTEEPGGLQSMGSQSRTQLTHTHTHTRPLG